MRGSGRCAVRRCADESDATHIFEKMPRSEIQAIAGERRHYLIHHQFLVKFVGDDEYDWVAAETILEQMHAVAIDIYFIISEYLF